MLLTGHATFEEIELLSERRTKPYVFSASGPWVAGEWTDWSDPYRSGWGRTETPCKTKPADDNEVDEVGLGTATRKVLNAQGDRACTQTEVLSQSRTNVYVLDSSSGWSLQEGEWGIPYRSGWRTTGPCVDRPSADLDVLTIETKTETRWWPMNDGLFCLEYEQTRTGVRQSHYLRPYVWNATAMEWQVGPRNPSTPIFTHPPGAYIFTDWEDTGDTRLCPLQARESDGAASARLSAGSYVA